MLTPLKLYLTNLMAACARVGLFYANESGCQHLSRLAGRSIHSAGFGGGCTIGRSRSLGHPPAGAADGIAAPFRTLVTFSLIQRAETRQRQTPPGAAFAYHCDCQQLRSAGGRISRSQPNKASSQCI